MWRYLTVIQKMGDTKGVLKPINLIAALWINPLNTKDDTRDAGAEIVFLDRSVLVTESCVEIVRKID